MMRCAVFVLLFVSFVKADDDWDDFTNNLATDLAPLITLFGERLTKQFLSESISALDNVIFALSPLGVLTAVVSVIRICGSSSLRAFVGRAQEGPAEAEMELLPCVSESTAELFNDGGVARVLGRPKIVEIVCWQDEKNGEVSTRIGTMNEALEEGVWSCRGKTAPSELPELDIPNLSLNKGIKRRGQGWFYCAAVLGGVLQSGTIIYAALTVFVFPQHFKKDDKAVASYAFPFYFIGTTLLFIGMFFCAFIMERSSKEFYLKPKKASKIYWLQPGNQDVGDQAFNTFLAVKENPDEYIKSVRDHRFDRKYTEIYSTLASTLLGFILQFVGLRGLHASVILAQLGSTFLMAVIRTCLRTERMAPGENKMRDDRDLTSDKKQELDCFAFHLLNVDSFDLVPLPDRSANISSPCLAPLGNPLAKQLIQTRVQLARLTSNSNQSMNVNWDDMPIRQVSRKLAKVIESTMDLLSDWGVDFGTTFEFRLGFACAEVDSTSIPEPPGTYSIGLMRSGDVLRWKVDANELEAVLGLWVWSLVKSNEHWREPDTTFCRLIGLDGNEASLEQTYFYFHKWIFRQTEARLVSPDAIHYTQRLFMPEPEDNLSEKTVLTMRTSSPLECLVAQNIFVHFLNEAMASMKELGGDVDVVPGIQASFLCHNTRINELVSAFEESDLGTREDGLLCIVPALKKRSLLPPVAADSPMVKTRIQTLVKQGKWEDGFDLIRWICGRPEEPWDYQRSVYELGFLCRHTMLSNSPAVRIKGAEQIYRLLKSDTRDDFFQTRKFSTPSSWTKSQSWIDFWLSFRAQLGWVAWEISKDDPGMRTIKDNLESMGVQETLQNSDNPTLETDDLKTTTRVLKHWLTIDHDREGGLSIEDGDEICFDWTIRNSHYALLYFLLLRMIELSEENPSIPQVAFTTSAKYRVGWAMELLIRHDLDIDSVDAFNHSALIQSIAISDLSGAQLLLDYGAIVHGADRPRAPRPLIAAVEVGNVDMIELLLQYGASPHAFDSRGLTPMWWASRSGEIKLVDVLLRHGAPIDPIECHETPLLFAASEEQIDMLKFLIEKGANINARDSDGHTALMSAAAKAKSEIVDLLVGNGADVHMHDSEGMTALDLVGEGHQALVERLQDQDNMSSRDLDLIHDLQAHCLHIEAVLEQFS